VRRRRIIRRSSPRLSSPTGEAADPLSRRANWRRSHTRRSSLRALPQRGQRRSSAKSAASGAVAQRVRPQEKHASRGMPRCYVIAPRFGELPHGPIPGLRTCAIEYGGLTMPGADVLVMIFAFASNGEATIAQLSGRIDGSLRSPRSDPLSASRAVLPSRSLSPPPAIGYPNSGASTGIERAARSRAALSFCPGLLWFAAKPRRTRGQA
jgi:hypothetical protein